jgi:hypothetical protein
MPVAAPGRTVTELTSVILTEGPNGVASSEVFVETCAITTEPSEVVPTEVLLITACCKTVRESPSDRDGAESPRVVVDAAEPTSDTAAAGTFRFKNSGLVTTALFLSPLRAQVLSYVME